MRASTPPARPRRGGGVALGVLGVALLSFFAIIFMLGRHTYFHSIYDALLHDPRLGHHDPVDLGKRGSPAVAAKPDDPVVVATPSPGPSPKPSPVVPKKQEAVTPAGAKKKEKFKSDKPGKKEVVKLEAKTPEEEGITALDNKYKPTKEMVQGLQQDGYLVVTWANWHYQDFVMTWVAHVRSVGITGYIVGAMDDQLLQALIDRNMNTFSMKSGLTLGDFGWGSKTFAKMGREKIRLVALFLRLGVSVVIADVDVLWLRNPLPYFERYTEADVLTSSDHLSNTVDDESLEIWPRAASAANIGIMLFRNKSLDFVDEWIKIIEADETVWDQNAFNDLFRKGTKVLENDPKHYFLGYHESLKMGILPVSLFCSGHTFFTQRMYETLHLKPYAVHATFQFSGTPGKRNRMREHMLFEDGPEYYDHPVGFVSFTMDGVEPLLGSAGPRTGRMDLANVQGHFDLVNHQIIRIRNALAIASLLQRALIVPEIWCGLDRWWAPHAGVIPGSSFKVPFKCPLDHVFDLEGGWSRQMDENAFGHNIQYKESSFLANPRMPKAVLDSKVSVEICAAGTPDCSDGKKPATVKDSKVRIQEGLTSDGLITALSSIKDTKVLDFTTMNKAFGNFSDPNEWRRFADRMKQYGSIWCCIHAHPGHIHYDLLFDVPHADKFNRLWNGTWEVKTGP